MRENPRKCCRILAQLLYLQNDTKNLSNQLTLLEATDLFFASTKLFVDVEDASLRRLLYLFIKEIQPLCDPSDVIIVTSCLTKDMTCDVGLYRANAIRVLVHIIDSSFLGSIERYIKQAILDNDQYVSNSALVSASHLFSQSNENATIVRKWVGEVQEMLIQRSKGKSGNDMVQSNAMRLLCLMKSHDRLGMAKLLQQFSGYAGSNIRSSLAIVIVIRLAGKLLIEEVASYGNSGGDISSVSSLSKLCFDFLESSLEHSDNMISYEAARTICLIPNIGAHELSRSMECFRGMLFSEKSAVRYASIKTFSTVNQPRAVALCNEGLEACVADENKQIATLAVSTLLKSGNEPTIDKVLGILPSLMSAIEDEQKVEILGSLEHICLLYPAKHRAIVGFLSIVLREEGGYEFKQSIVNSVVSLIKKAPETAESSLLILCEFIDDCEYSTLSTHTMHIIAQIGPKTRAPARCIPFIYNRVILENAIVRSAAISVLSKFASQCPSLRSSIFGLLKHSLNDEDDEVRDRASIAVNVLKEAMELNPYVAPALEDYNEVVDEPVEGDLAALVFLNRMPISFKNLEHSIKAYTSTPGLMESEEGLTFNSLPIIEDSHEDERNTDDKLSTSLGDKLAETKIRDPTAIYAIPELASFGRIFRSSAPTELSEEETEYVVRCIKHVMPEHVILQFIIQNTVEDQRLVYCTVAIEGDSQCFEVAGEVAAESIKYGETANAFTVVTRNPDEPLAPCNFECALHFGVIQVDPNSGEDESDALDEEYPLENLVLSPSDFMAKVAVHDFRASWNSTSDTNEALEKYTLQLKSMSEAVSSVTDTLGMCPCDGTGQAPKSGAKPHMLHLSGKYVGGHEVLARAQLTAKKKEGIMLKISIRSDDKTISDAIMSCIN